MLMPGRGSLSGESVTTAMEAGTSNGGVATRVAVIVTACAGAAGAASGAWAAQSAQLAPASAAAVLGQRARPNSIFLSIRGVLSSSPRVSRDTPGRARGAQGLARMQAPLPAN